MSFKKSELNLMVINNFILYFSSDEAERERMKQVASDYIEEDHVDGKEAEDDSPMFTVSDMRSSFQQGATFERQEASENNNYDVSDFVEWIDQVYEVEVTY